MVNEFAQGLHALIGIGIALAAAGCWMISGRAQEQIPPPFNKIRNRHWGRWIAPLIISGGTICLSLAVGSFKWWFLLSLAAYKGVSHMGYGGDTLWAKVLRRALWSLVWTAASITFCLFTGAWIVYATQATIGLCVAILWGVTNPVVAPREETFIKFMNIVCVPFMVL